MLKLITLLYRDIISTCVILLHLAPADVPPRSRGHRRLRGGPGLQGVPWKERWPARWQRWRSDASPAVAALPEQSSLVDWKSFCVPSPPPKRHMSLGTFGVISPIPQACKRSFVDTLPEMIMSVDGMAPWMTMKSLQTGGAIHFHDYFSYVDHPKQITEFRSSDIKA